MSERDTHYHGDEEVMRRNVEESKRVIEERKQTQAERKTERPGVEPGEMSEDALPGQQDVPFGGTTGPNATGGSSKRHKPN